MADLFDIANLITTVGVDAVKIKSEPGLPEKSSNEILTELFSTFDADEGIISPGSGDNEIAKDISVKSEKSDKLKKKKSKKKHKHKDKKHKKKTKKHSSDSDSEAEDGSKKRKKHKKKSKRKRDTSSSRTSESDEQKRKVQKIDSDGFKKNSKISENYLNDEFDATTNGNANKNDSKLAENSLIKTEPGLAMPEHSVHQQHEALLEPSSPRQPFVASKTNKDNLEDIVMPRLLENPKQGAAGKILIKDLKHSVVYSEVVKEVENKAREKAARMEDGELSDSSGNDRTPTLSPSPSSCDNHGTPSLSPESNRSIVRTPSPMLRLQQVGVTLRNDLRMILKEKEKKRREEIKSKLRNGKQEREDKTRRDSNDKGHEEKHHRKSGSRERKRSKSKSHSRSQRSRSKGKERSREKSRDRRDRERSRDRWDHEWNRDRRKISKDGDKDRYRSRSRDRSRDRRNNRGRTRSRERKERIEIDKKKLLEIARKNAISMIQQGTLPLAQQDKVIAAIQAGGKSVDELTDFCKSLSKSEALGELSSISSDDDGSNSEKGFHHPFLVKDRPNSIIMNIRDAKQLPTKTFQEKAAESSTQLRLQFPVSSGQHHRKTENEWVPVNPKKPEPKKPTAPVTAPPEPLAIMPAPTQSPAPVPAPAPIPTPAPTPAPQSPVFSQPSLLKNVDIGCIVSQRLAAMRKLRENPNDVQALNEMYRAQNGMKSWAESKQMPGQFTGSTGVKVLSASELSAGYQAWARKDQLLTAQPVSGGMGMALLQKMGWRPGEGLGKNKEGTLVPLQLEVKLDKRGLVSDQDIGSRVGKTAKPVVPTIKTLEGKHPVSLLGEYCSKRKFGAPVYELCFECGPDHKKNFLFKVKVNGIEYKPSVASPNKKQAKAEAAQICLQTLGLLAA
ncbi:protein Son isoform X1 [Neodiprion lecontei]|uniref:Protein Son isoform X1 n=1 Tax=Neodiprion lecontei TaxID=441921 RepID=A0A6J0BCK7_NEOLC|nr:protein Son isoform X1 [Neodiprion lecontei]